MFGIRLVLLATCGLGTAGAAAQSPQFAPAAGMATDGGVAKRQENAFPASFATPHTQAPFSPPAIRFRGGRAILSDLAVVRSTRAEIGSSSRLLTLDATRIRRSPAEMRETAGLRRGRSIIWSADLGYERRIGQDDSIRLAAAIGAEKRKPLIAIADGRWTGTTTVAAGLGWRHGGGLALDAGWFGVGALRSLTAIDRNVVLAAGSAIAERGYQAAASIPLADRQARLGIRVATAAVARDDRRALGATGARDSRAIVSLGIRFP